MSDGTSAKKHPHLPPVPDFSPIKASPSTSPLKSAAGKENIVTPKERRVVLASRNGNLPQVPNVLVNRTAKEKQRALGSVVNGCISRTTSCNVECISLTTSQRSGKQSTGVRDVRDRVRDWERERERLREMARLEETERERDEELEKGKQKEQYRREISIREHEVYSKENHDTVALNKIVSSSPTITPPLAQGELPVLPILPFFTSAVKWLSLVISQSQIRYLLLRHFPHQAVPRTRVFVMQLDPQSVSHARILIRLKARNTN